MLIMPPGDHATGTNLSRDRQTQTTSLSVSRFLMPPLRRSRYSMMGPVFTVRLSYVSLNRPVPALRLRLSVI